MTFDAFYVTTLPRVADSDIHYKKTARELAITFAIFWLAGSLVALFVIYQLMFVASPPPPAGGHSLDISVPSGMLWG
jgi:hypothetical protein